VLQFLNVFFLVFHTTWMLFNCVGWIWKRTRPWHLLTVALTAASWFVLGFWYDWGYCVCTDWHWQVRDRLGYPRDYETYTQLLIREVTGFDVPGQEAELITAGIFAVVTVLTIVLNLRDFLRKRRTTPDRPAR
jgi:hypothetical protein